MTITSVAPLGVGLTTSAVNGAPSWRFAPRVVSKPPVVICHGDPASFTADVYFAGSIAQYVQAASGSLWGPVQWALHSTGRSTHVQWTGSNWGTGAGFTNLSAMIDALVGPSGSVDLIGQSMGGVNVLAWALANPTRVKSLMLISPVVSLLDQFDVSTPFAQEIALAWTGSTGGTRSAVSTASASVDPARNTAGFASIADRMFIMAANNDTTVPPGPAKTWATAVGIPTDRQLWTSSGGHSAPMWASTYDDLTILKNIERCALL